MHVCVPSHLLRGAECVVEDVDVGEAYFQCVYLRMNPSPQLAKVGRTPARVVCPNMLDV